MNNFSSDYLNKFNLSEHVVIITGAAGLLGKEFARSLAQVKAIPVLADIKGELTEKTAYQISKETGTQSFPIQFDVSSKISVTQMVETVITRFGRIDGLVNNAALDPKFDAEHTDQYSNAFEDYPLELWNQGIAVNLTGMFLCAQAVAPQMLAQHKGSIVNICSIYGLTGPDQRLYQPEEPNLPRQYKPVVYSVTKSAVLGLTKYLAVYWGEKGIRVNSLTPGGTFNNHDEEFVRRYSLRTPMGRMGDKTDYPGSLLFLLSDASEYMTGANLVVDGGWTAW